MLSTHMKKMCQYEREKGKEGLASSALYGIVFQEVCCKAVSSHQTLDAFSYSFCRVQGVKSQSSHGVIYSSKRFFTGLVPMQSDAERESGIQADYHRPSTKSLLMFSKILLLCLKEQVKVFMELTV